MANKNKKQELQKSDQSFIANSWEGAIPHPADLEKYENMCKGSTDRFIGLIEKEQNDVYELNSQFLDIQRSVVNKHFISNTIWQFIIALFIVAVFIFSYFLRADVFISRFSAIMGIIGTLFTIYSIFKEKKTK